jgi:hypothetical protein
VPHPPGDNPRVREQRWARHTAVVLAAVIIFVGAAVVGEWPWWEYAFLSDDSPLAWLSSALLFANAAVALMLTVMRLLPGSLGALVTMALSFLATDEQFLLHERWQETVGGVLAFVPTILVGVGGVACLLWLRAVIRSRAALVLLACGVAVGIVGLWIDLGSPPSFLSRTEELYEVLAETLFLCGLLEAGRAHVQSGW